MIYAVILACEIGFWVAIGLGLAARYLLRRPRLGAALLVTAPVLDGVLLVATAVHLRSGAEPSGAHSLAALYLGFSLAYGHAMIRWADVRFAHRFAGGPAPVRVYGAARARASWRDVGRTGLAAAVAVAVMAGLAWFADVPFDPFVATVQLLALILAIEVVVAVCDTVWPRKAPAVAGPMALDGRR
ncbi:hypothetical protein FDO65_08645 [Nakamurella flava]|uniref:Uncharacterized protein n=1 Tax=Nakamurella flava TaxID=2576308 RepID=A0A4U6QM30_9ACTN|nr:hypothetical protein [Nakamurella flava]TKV61613.1 hypothetical protein FDO65_08645 [Nakamurella flava]